MTFLRSSGGKVNLHYQWIDNNKDDTYVFINALGTDFRIWDEVVEILGRHGNTLRFDKQGHGLSSLTEETCQLEHYLADLIELVQGLEIKRSHVVGLSVGGMIAQLMAFHHPQLVDKLILCDTRHKIGDSDGWNGRIRQVNENGMASISELVLQRWFSPAFMQENTRVVDGIRIMLNRCDTRGYIQTCKAIRDADLTEKARQIKHQSLCIVGSEDKSTPVADVKSLSKLIPNSRFEIITGSGHLPCVDNPKKLSAQILDFVRK